jgi:hypothetical protein
MQIDAPKVKHADVDSDEEEERLANVKLEEERIKQQQIDAGIKPTEPIRKETKEKVESKGFFSSFIARFFGKKARAPPSAADPSVLAGQPIENEDDVLHIKNHKLPTFGGRVNQRNSELLLSYLTAPYLRLPLVLSFFATQERLNALGSEQLRALLDGVLFEPGLWKSKTMSQRPLPDSIPYDKSFLSTSCGLLFNELLFSPAGVLKSLHSLLDLALDLDTGRYSETTSPIILYIIRLLVRVEGYMQFIVLHHRTDKKITNSKWSNYIRGLETEDSVADSLHASQQKLRSTLNTQVFPMLERWVQVSTKQNDLVTACILYAHLAYLYKNIPQHLHTRQTVTTLLSSQIFLTTRYIYDLDCIPGEIEKRKKKKIKLKKPQKKQKKKKVN